MLELPTDKSKVKLNSTLKVEKPSYLASNDKIVKKSMSWRGKLNRLKRLFTNENIEKTDPNVLHGFKRIQLPSKEEMHRISYRWIKKEPIDVIEGKKYVFFGFHKQPEASIDVCGRYFENQLENVLNIWRMLPNGWFLVVKEHSNAIGDRGYRFFKEIKKYPFIFIVHENVDSHQLIGNSRLVITNTGTMALEAALMGIPSITLSPVFFNRLNYCRCCDWTDIEKYSSLEVLIEEIKSLPDNKKEYEEFIVANSMEGILSDVKLMPAVLEEENLSKLVKSFLCVIQ